MEKKRDFVISVLVYVVSMLVSIMMRVYMDRATNHLTRLMSGIEEEEDAYERNDTVYHWDRVYNHRV